MVGRRLKALREDKKITQEELGSILHLSKKTISAYENNQIDPSTETLKRIADFFGVTTDYLLDYPEKNFIKESVAEYKPTLDELRAQIAAIENRSHNSKNDFIPAVQVPILGVIRAGRPIYAEENIEGYAYIDQYTASAGEHFYLRVKGDSMEPTIEEGSLVLIRRQDDVLPGQIAVVIVNDEDATLKRVYCDEYNCILQSDNTDYPPMVYPKEEVKILGRAVKVTKDLR